MTRPSPTPSTVTAPFWAATAEETFLLQHCRRCGALQFYPKTTCTTCGSEDLDWQPASGRGTVHTYTVARRATHPAFNGMEPYVVAIIELDEGPHVTGNVVDCPVDDVVVGLPVTLAWAEANGDGIRLPLWRPA